MGSIAIVITYPVMVREKNVGAIFLTSNITTTSHIKPVDIRFKYDYEYVDDVVVRIVCVQSVENESNVVPKM